MKSTMLFPGTPVAALALCVLSGLPLQAATNQVLGWNNLGMHCMDSDYSVFSILPPYNTLEAQLLANGQLVTNGAGYTITYEAVADPAGSFNSSAIGKGNFYTYVDSLYGAALAPDAGLAGWNMPGISNVPQSMLFEVSNSPAAGVLTRVNWYRAEGIPISPYDDSLKKNPYPLMRLIARNTANQPIATNDVVLPVSDEMDCRACHASGSQEAAKPAAGWVWDGLPERDFRLNILRLHDEHEFQLHSNLYSAALAARGFNPQGLYRGVLVQAKPVLCAACHASEALGAPSFDSVPALTTSVHAYHAHVSDPIMNTALDNVGNRSACYRCHPGSTTRCLRGAMGSAIASDGSMEMQCQSCHGNMSAVGATNRIGWFMEPNCQSCHSGTATVNGGLIRFTTCFSNSTGAVRQPADRTFATLADTPAPGLSLYRFSAGHGGLQCSACHGSTHAEFPSSHRNDNIRNQSLQGHSGMMVECTACHAAVGVTTTTMAAGPHGMHPISQSWVDNHHNLLSGGTAACQSCHGTDYRGTVLSRAQANRNWSAFGTTLSFMRGSTVGCYTCHLGPGEGDANPSVPPTVANVSTNTTNDKAVVMVLQGTLAGTSLHVVSQPANGTVGLTNNIVTYSPLQGFIGVDQFTYLAYDGSKNSGLGTGTVTVAQGPYSLGAVAHVPPEYPAGWPVPFAIFPTLTNTVSATSFIWNFGDSIALHTNQFPTHVYPEQGAYAWTVVTAAGAVSTTNTGTIVITAPMHLTATTDGQAVIVSWPNNGVDALLERTIALGTNTQWLWVSNVAVISSGQRTVTLSTAQSQFFRLRRVW